MTPARPWRLKVFALAVLVGGLVLDLGSKAWLEGMLGMDPGTQGPFGEVDLIPGFFALQGTYNPGVTFGLAPGQTGFILLFTGVATAGLLTWLLLTRRDSRILHAALGLILAGALGNLWDRSQFHKVRDFFLIYTGELSRPSWRWPNFNVADTFIVVGVVLILLDELILTPRKERRSAIGGTTTSE